MAQARKGDRQIGGVLYLVTRRRRTDDDHRLPGHAKTWTGGKRKNENRRTNGRTLDKQGAIEINREYCEEYAQTRNSHSSSPSAHFSYSLLLFPTSIRSISFFLSLSLHPNPSMSPFSLSFVRTHVFSSPDLRRSFGIRFYKRTSLLLRSRLSDPTGAA